PCAAGLDPLKRNRALAQMALLSGLRRLPEQLKMELKNMSSLLEDNEIVREWYERAIAKGLEQGLEKGLEKGRAEGLDEGKAVLLREMLEAKFGPLPSAVQLLIAKASTAEVEHWAKRMLKVDTMDAVFSE